MTPQQIMAEFRERFDCDIIEDGINPAYITFIGKGGLYSFDAVKEDIESFFTQKFTEFEEGLKRELRGKIEERKLSGYDMDIMCCKKCGGDPEDCDCGGYNKALSDILDLDELRLQ